MDVYDQVLNQEIQNKPDIYDQVMGTNPESISNYTVKPGDNLTKIAQDMGTSVDNLTGYSSGDKNLIHPGEEIHMKTSTLKAVQSGADPNDLVVAKQELGKKEYQGYCQAFVRMATNGATTGPSAISAFKNNPNSVQGMDGIQPGDVVYFTPNASNENYGHTGIYEGDNKFISATDNGVAEYNLDKWNQITGQQPLGYIPVRK